VKFLVTNLTASRVNLLMNDYASGLPSPLAFLGLGAAIAPELGATRWSVKVLPILHEVTVSSGRTKPEMAPESGRFSPIEIVEDLIGTVRFSMILDVPGCSSENAVQEALTGCRLAGGVFRNTVIQTKVVADDGASLRDAPRGWALIRPDDPARRIVSRGDADSLSAVARVLFPAEREIGFGWPVPVAVGHFLLEDPATVPRRQGTRDANLPHVFTEPVLGIGELVSVRNSRLTQTTGETFDDLFWGWHTDGSWILGHLHYYPKTPDPISQELR
jgi:hypothetical protein